MRRRLFNWQGQRFVQLGFEGEPGVALAQQARDLFVRADAELATLGLALAANTVRTRIFGRSAQARTAGSDARGQALLGASRASGSSYITAAHFESAADVGLDLLAMAAPVGNPARQVTEHAPLQSFIRHLVWGPMVFLAGMTCERFPDLRQQYEDILPRARTLLRETGCDWANVARVSLFLHRDENPQALLAGIAAVAPVPLDHAEIELVEGYSRPGKRLEIEITAKRTTADR
jgi:enamine deaminase RidA (YjgF/YER057c/UK114 family)